MISLQEQALRAAIEPARGGSGRLRSRLERGGGLPLLITKLHILKLNVIILSFKAVRSLLNRVAIHHFFEFGNFIIQLGNLSAKAEGAKN